MSEIRSWHWTTAMLLAMALHVAGYLWLASGPAASEVFRGGGSFGAQGDRPAPSVGLLVSLPSQSRESAPAQPTRAQPRAESSQPADAIAAAPPAPEPVEDPTPAEETSTADQLASLPDPNLPAVFAAPEDAPENAPEDVKVTAPPIPGRKPKPAMPEPELGLLEERLPLLGPEPEPSDSGDRDQAASAPSAAADESSIDTLVHVAGEGAIGTAGLNSEGSVPRLNYKDRVLLWLKRHGGYPEGSYRFRQEGVVLLHFAIDRSGRVLYYNIRKSSGYYLLDDAVKTMMDRASPVPPIPPEIAQDELEFTVPVRFTRS